MNNSSIKKSYNNKLCNVNNSNVDNSNFYSSRNFLNSNYDNFFINNNDDYDDEQSRILNDDEHSDWKTTEKIYKFIKKDFDINEDENARRTDENLNQKILTIDEWKRPRITQNKMQGRPSITLNIQGRDMECLLDTGARVNVLSKAVLDRLENVDIVETEELLRCANDSKLETIGKIHINVKIGNKEKKVTFTVVKNIVPDIIGGIELQNQFGIELTWIEETRGRAEYFICEIEANYGRKITDDERLRSAMETLKLNKNNRLIEIAQKHKNVFMADKWDIGCTGLIEHRIKTNGGPINIKPRRQPVNLEEKINDAIKNLENNDIIRKCNSPWNTPLVCVWKKDKKDIRLCLDFRQLNQITERQAFPMPNVEEILDTLYGSKYFSSIDLGNAYYQVRLDKESQEKTAFSTKEGQFCFNRMPFGIAAAPGTFQELMTKILKEMWKDGVMVYLDDILIFTNTIEEHYNVLESVLKKIEIAGLRINPEKCHLLKKEVKFLGHIINNEGVQTDPSKVEAIQSFQRPKCVKNLRSFLGICNYYRKFIKDYAKKSKALEAMCGKNNSKLIWSDLCEKAFEDMKLALTTSPILAFPDVRKEFILDTDASFDTIGAVLSQKDEYGYEHVISYGSHSMNDHERGYCITRKELLAIYYFCRHFNHYLYGKRFTLRTDHKAITFMLTTKKPITAQFQTWINYLSSLDIKMEFRKGATHSNADMLSRNTCGTCVQCLMDHEHPKIGRLKTKLLTIMAENNGENWQINSEEIQDIINRVNRQRTGRFIFENGIVYTNDKKIWIPASNRQEMIKKTHVLLCHAGAEKTIKYIQNNFDMEDLVSEVKRTISDCDACQRTKIVTTKLKEETKLNIATEPFEKIYMDICGPWKETKNRERYICAIIDHYSKYISLTAINKQDEKTIVKMLLNKWILKFGAPKELHVDCGKSFEANSVKELTIATGIKLIFSSPYHHNTNGIVERQFRTIREYINASLKSRSNTTWAEILPEVEYTLNSTTQKTNGVSPAEIIFGRKINRSKWFSNSKINREEIMMKLEAQRRENNIKTVRNLNIGDEVLIKQEIRNKDQDRYVGPYIVIKKVHERSYLLKDRGGKTVIRNIEKIKNLKKGGC